MNTQSHLTAAEFDAQLTQTAGSATAEAAALRATLADLRTSSMAAASMAAEFPFPAPRPDARPSHAPLLPRWAMATATAAMAVAFAVPAALHHWHPAATAPVASASATEHTAADTVAQDDALLADIQTDLSTSIPASLQPLDTTSTNTLTNSTSTTTTSK
jgi:hypothetical protein